MIEPQTIDSPLVGSNGATDAASERFDDVHRDDVHRSEVRRDEVHRSDVRRSEVRRDVLRGAESWDGGGAGGQTSGSSASRRIRTPLANRDAGTGGGLLAELYAPVAEPMALVDGRITRELQNRYESLNEVLRHGTQLGGKRMRPALTLLAAVAASSENASSSDASSDAAHSSQWTPPGGWESHVVLGTVIEMVHTATLIHDDVLDDATHRRHVQTINARHGVDTSILLGDYLFASAYRLAATLPTTDAALAIGEAATLVCEGELRQVLDRDDWEMDQSTYIELIRGKTARLLETACRLGAHYASATSVATDAMATYGDALGIAFQIADDYLDIWGDGDRIGKTLGTDLQQGKPTLPILRLLESVSDGKRHQLIETLRGPADLRYHRIKDDLDHSDARAYTASVAKHYRDIAVDALADLADSPAKRSLIRIADFSIARTF